MKHIVKFPGSTTEYENADSAKAARDAFERQLGVEAEYLSPFDRLLSYLVKILCFILALISASIVVKLFLL